MMKIRDFSAGSHHAAMVDELGRVFTWGAGSYGRWADSFCPGVLFGMKTPSHQLICVGYLNMSCRTGLNDTMDTHVPTWISALDHPRGKIE